MLVGVRLLCPYDSIFVIFVTDLRYSNVSVLVTEWILFLYQQACACTSVKALVLPVWLHFFAIVIAAVSAWLHYLYCYSAVTRSYQPEWQVKQNMLESRDKCTRPDNNSKLFQNQVELWPLLCGMWSPFLLSYHCFIGLTCNDWGAYSSSEYAHMALKIFFENLHSSMLFRFIYCR